MSDLYDSEPVELEPFRRAAFVAYTSARRAAADSGTEPRLADLVGQRAALAVLHLAVRCAVRGAVAALESQQAAFEVSEADKAAQGADLHEKRSR